MSLAVLYNNIMGLLLLASFVFTLISFVRYKRLSVAKNHRSRARVGIISTALYFAIGLFATACIATTIDVQKTNITKIEQTN